MMKVMIATDGSETAERAVDLATTLLKETEIDARIIHVIPRHLIYGPRAPIVAESFDMDEAKRHGADMLERTIRRLKAAGLGPTIKPELATGDPADVILMLAEKEETDLIILGSRGLNAAERFLRGSVSNAVYTHAPCSVLVAYKKD